MSLNNNNWQEEVKTDVKKIINQYDPAKLANIKKIAKKKTMGLIMFIFSLLATIGFGIGIFKTMDELILLIVMIICFLICVGFLTWAVAILSEYRKVVRWISEVMGQVNYKEYYHAALQENSEQGLQLIDLTQSFKTQPFKFLPSGKTKVDNVLVIFSEQQQNYYCYGTITQQIKQTTTDSKGRTTTHYYYYRFPFLTAQLNRDLELNAVIQRSKGILKIFQGDNTTLESDQFEKLYAVNADNQITIRKLLTPKVMVNLIDNADRGVPKVAISNNLITLSFSSFSVSGWSDPKGMIWGDIFNSPDTISEDICKEITTNLNEFFPRLDWLKVYDLI
ncbi:hypothetical protein SSYRP_v1c00830 [Spiroplasma syrphidicola EA-1]|uniref:Transmembrane protein n=1 Tax=Spiroplasma syrphidicola EA-1 TaxID=1276229 RepID=R4UCT3_9MOLU|nr:DUF3137 domain-containing protein [Spiroplasma syrphidicola]AGM25679.1 hypothetical protein SSYRP_v1c00830 [Spiroplasma syrphidicola EA-1]